VPKNVEQHCDEEACEHLDPRAFFATAHAPIR
jgi:hypothetical protein